MSSFIESVKAFAGDEHGATAIEYALIATAIFLAIVPPMTVIASRMGTTYQQILNYFNSV